MVAHACGDDDVLLTMLEPIVDGFDGALRLEALVGRRRVLERELGFEFVGALEPRLARVLGRVLRDDRQEGREGHLAVTRHGDGRVDDTTELRRLDVEVDQPAAPLSVRLFCLGRVLAQDASGSVVEAGADGDDQVGLLDGKVGVRGAVHAEHMERVRVVLVKRAHCMHRRRHRHVARLSERSQLEMGAIRALPDVKDRLLRDRE